MAKKVRYKQPETQIINADNVGVIDEENVISHSIIVTKQHISKQAQLFLVNNQKKTETHLTKVDIDKLIIDYEKRGYKIGALVSTKYNRKGKIVAFTKPQFGNCIVATSDNPYIIKLEMDDGMPGTFNYSLDELTLIGEQNAN